MLAQANFNTDLEFAGLVKLFHNLCSHAVDLLLFISAASWRLECHMPLLIANC